MKLGLLMSVLILMAQVSFASIPQSQKKIDHDIRAQWRRFIQAETLSDKRAIKELATLFEYQLEHGIDAIPTIAQALLGKINPGKLTKPMAEHIYWIYARRFDPYNPAPDYLLCRHDKQTPLSERAKHCLSGFKRELQTQQGRMLSKAFLAHVLYVSLIVTILCSFVCLLLRYTPFLCQLASSKAPWLSPSAIAVLTGLICLGLGMAFGWVIVLILIALMTWSFASLIERASLLTLLFLVGLVPLTFDAPAQYIQFASIQAHTRALAQSAQQRLYTSATTFAQGADYQHFIQSMHARTFFRNDQIQLYTMLISAAFLLLLLGIFQQKAFYFSLFQKQSLHEKKVILKDLHPFPILYFNFIRKLQKQDSIKHRMYLIFPPYYYFDYGRPIKGILLTFILCFVCTAIILSQRLLHPMHLVWSAAWASLLLLLLLLLWSRPKHDRYRELYAKNT